jgi:hypothetical protein
MSPCTLKKPIALDMADLSRMDIAYQQPFDQEKLLIEDGQVVGVTATIEDNKVNPTNGRIPTGYMNNGD